MTGENLVKSHQSLTRNDQSLATGIFSYSRIFVGIIARLCLLALTVIGNEKTLGSLDGLYGRDGNGRP